VTLSRLDDALEDAGILDESYICITSNKTTIKDKLKEACRYKVSFYHGWKSFTLLAFWTISIAESFYKVKYGLSKNPTKNFSKENIKTGISRKIVCFGILIHVLS
jgi:hypothetical protein